MSAMDDVMVNKNYDDDCLIIYDDYDSLQKNSDEEDINAAFESLDRKNKLPNYQILTIDEVANLMKRQIAEAEEVTGLSNEIIRVQLNYFKWDKENYLEYAFTDREKLFSMTKIIDPDLTEFSSKPNALSDCLICFDSFPPDKFESLPCGHVFCFDCWRQFLISKMDQEGAIEGIFCPEFKCRFIVEENLLKKLVKDNDPIQRFQRLIVDAYVLSSRLLKHCPGKECSKIAKVDHINLMKVICTCGYSFCFLCGDKWHEPARCDIMKEWNRKCAGETIEKIDCETANWILSNTKDCPKCNVAIEKNGGCNHMTCKNASCRFEFCWICMADWKQHNYERSCNRFDDKKEAEKQARTKLQRYIHYWSRFHNHQKSLQSEKKLISQMNTLMEQLQQVYGMVWIEVQFLMESFKTLCHCRHTLMYSYAFAYFLEKNNFSEIFEDNQQYLETSTEELSGFLEKKSEEWQPEFKERIINLEKYCKDRRKELIKHVMEGYEKEWWKFVSVQ